MFRSNELQTSDMNVLNKLTKEEWDSIEKQVDRTTQEVLNQMLLYGRITDTKSERSKLKTCGETVYLTTIRPQLVKMKLLDEIEKKVTIEKAKSKSKHKHCQKKTENDIRQETMAKIVNNELKEVAESFNMTKLSYDYGLKKSIVELRMATLLYMSQYFLDNNVVEEEFYRLIQTIYGVISLLKTESFMSCLNSINSEKACDQLIEDLTQKKDQLEKKVDFKIKNIFNKFPWLTDRSNYFRIIPEFNINLYKCQLELLELTKTSKSFLGFYKSNFGSGKTTATIGVVANQINGDGIVIYCCASDAVRHTVCQLAYNASIKFAIANVFKDTIRITNNNLCKQDKERKLVIADYVTTLEILCDSTKYLPNNKFEDIILIVDEPTDGADEPNNIKTKYFSRIFYHCPRRTLLVSATLPSEEELSPYVKIFKQRFGDITVKHILSKDVKVGCEIILRNGTSYTPHSDCKTSEEIVKVIEKLRTNQFLGRLYTANILYSLLDAMEEAEIDNLPDIDSLFMNSANLNHNCIKDTAITLLEILSNQQDEVIEVVCQCKSSYSRQDIYKDTEVDKKFDLKLLGTRDAHKFMGPTLLVGDDPFKLSETCFNSLLKDEDATRIINNYRKAQENEKKAMAKFTKQLEKVATSKSEKEDKLTKEQKQKEIQDMMESIDVKIGFPPWKQINTHSHVVKYGNGIIDHVNKRYIRYSANLSDIPLDTAVLDSIKLCRFAGVGIYSPGSKDLDTLYTNDVIENTLRGTLAFTVASTNISYGVNSPADNIIINDEAIRGKSIGTILQLLARVGRPGLSWTAFAFIDKELQEILSNYVFDRSVYYPDAENMNLALNNYIEQLAQEEKERVSKENDKLDKQKEKLAKELQVKTNLMYVKQRNERKSVESEADTEMNKVVDAEKRYRSLLEREFREDILKVQKKSEEASAKDGWQTSTRKNARQDHASSKAETHNNNWRRQDNAAESTRYRKVAYDRNGTRPENRPDRKDTYDRNGTRPDRKDRTTKPEEDTGRWR